MTDISGPARLAANPILKTVGQGDDKQFVCEVSVRILNSRQKKDSEEWEDNGFWADVNLWDKSGEAAARLYVKGDKVHIIGNLIERHWDDKDDPEIEHSRLQVNALIMAPYLPDLESLKYKPRMSQLTQEAESGDDFADSIPGGLADAS